MGRTDQEIYHTITTACLRREERKGRPLQRSGTPILYDLPWNPAKLEQRIARAWRKNQTRPVTVINLIAEGTIEHGMLLSLAQKTELADGVLDGYGELDQMTFKRGGQAFLKRLEQVMAKVPGKPLILPLTLPR